MNDLDAVRKLLQWRKVRMTKERDAMLRRLFFRDLPILFFLFVVLGFEVQTEFMGHALVNLIARITR